jgi:primary-amine oxidase
MENAICLHEEDDGIGWKHTNYRTGVAAVIRARILVLQIIITVANYEYIFVHPLTKFTNILGMEVWPSC